MTSELRAYLDAASKSGLTPEQTAGELRAAGWTTEQIVALMAETTPFSQMAPAPTLPVLPVIAVRDLVKHYASTVAVNGISFDVFRGEVFGILGPNGAGKTTTLEMVEGLRRPTSGSITVDGKDVLTQTQAVKEIIGVQPQASNFFEGLTLAETLALFGSLYGRSVDPMHLLTEVQLTEKAHAQVNELSGGQKQRFSIAVGLVNEPTVLFLDEPTTGLDPQARRNLWGLVREVNARGTTVVLTTHYMDEAEVLCDRIAVMDHAHIVALDDTEKLLVSHGGVPSIEFRSLADIPDGVLAGIEGVQSVRFEDGVYTLTTADPKHTLDLLFNAARTHGFSVDELSLKRPTLEDVFLALTGHALRD